MKKYRVWTKDFGGGVTCITDWMTKGQCKKMILGRWGHHPPFAFISSAICAISFRHVYGE